MARDRRWLAGSRGAFNLTACHPPFWLHVRGGRVEHAPIWETWPVYSSPKGLSMYLGKQTTIRMYKDE